MISEIENAQKENENFTNEEINDRRFKWPLTRTRDPWFISFVLAGIHIFKHTNGMHNQSSI